MERSTDAIHLASVGRIQAQGSGTRYILVDPMPMPGRNFYRLREVDMNVQETFFDIKNFYFEEAGLKQFLVNPNPVTNKALNIRINRQDDFLLTIHDRQGRLLFSRLISSASPIISIPLPEETPTIYSVSLSSEKGRWTEKVMVR